MTYEKLLREAAQHGIDIYEMPMRPRLKGLYSDNVIGINKYISSSAEKVCVLAEELGHYHTSSGNILDQRDIRNRKQERRARAWAYRRLVPLSAFVQAHKQGIRNRYEFADFLGVTEEFLESAIAYYQEKYGLSVKIGHYTIRFDPLGVLELLD